MSRLMETIEKANERGVGQFHVFGNEQLYVAGEPVGKHRYVGSFNSIHSARAVAANQDTGRVYNANGKDVTSPIDNGAN